MELLSFKKLGNGKVNITLDLSTEESVSFLEKEESLAILLNQAGLLATAALLNESLEASKRIELDGEIYYAKAAQKKTMRVPMVK